MINYDHHLNIFNFKIDLTKIEGKDQSFKDFFQQFNKLKRIREYMSCPGSLAKPILNHG